MSAATVDLEFRLDFLLKAKDDICAGVRNLKGEELREHMHYVAEQIAPLVEFAIAKAYVPLSAVQLLRNVKSKLMLAVGVGAAVVVLLALLLKLVGNLVEALGVADKSKAIGASIDNAGTIVLDFLYTLFTALSHASGRAGDSGQKIETEIARNESLKRKMLTHK